MDHSFPKSEHLKHKKLFDQLFRHGQRAFQYPVMAVWVETKLPTNGPIQVGFSAPKKHYKKAVTRNSIKRLMRESYRLQKHSLYEYLQAHGKQMALLLVTVKTDNTSYEALQPKILLLLQEIEEKLRNAE